MNNSARKKRYAQSPHAANAYFNAGMILYEQNRLAAAREQFKAYLEKYPQGDRKDTALFMMRAVSAKVPPAEQGERLFLPSLSEETSVSLLPKVSTAPGRFTFSLDIGPHGGSAAPGNVKTTVIAIRNGTLLLNSVEVSEKEFTIHPAPGKLLRINGTPYRGYVRIGKGSRSGLDVVNILPLEDYLYGTVPKEMSPEWLPEALKAQAIAARTYALYQMYKEYKPPFRRLRNDGVAGIRRCGSRDGADHPSR